MSGRTRVLAGVLVVLAVAVVADRLVLRGGEEAEGEGVVSARTRYLRAAELVGETRALIEHASEYQAALAETRARWDALRDRLVTAPSAGLAEAQFRDEVLEFVRRRDIQGARTSRIESTAIDENERLRLLELRLDFQTPATGDVYRLIDELEHMRGLLTRVAAVDIGGPGRMQAQKTVSASITVEAIAFVEGGG